ncbi:(2Fe-2S) ferredoxin domain-containing protein [Magnetospirillum gryphiswaldense]|uniref:Ferredoxin, 2Fe-2S n=1 Tax=Magnetospirillum gryphiswaldense TaxID=55518 RepID=A4TVK9_9PROT|nr:(2Fe-2S) ferredoxin domain-containing protein [Magnetospirillum gryphiswaldense]AVM73419.1 Ferredoxin, 2Fe-2S [Magnetospirillum gryphiswaldense MSR-1]AVM77322.1 Ferredoxin, 2Fe-2S [Magnetospirillum gryphiswaldense]CAM74666.1 Ferredoxin, 2Fe-2S [Magnetospirillum gryphiswaldense MSR-1]
MSHKYHVFVCTTSRPAGHPRGCCTSKGGGTAMFDQMMARFQKGMLWEKGVSLAQASCLGFCGNGPLMVVYPEGIWYQPVEAADYDEIVDSHFKKGQVVERLRVNPGH